MALCRKLATATLFGLLLSVFQVREVRADIASADVEGTYDLFVGVATSCPRNMTFESGSSDLDVEAENILIGAVDCSGTGKVELKKSVVISNATKFLAANTTHIGEFYAGSVSGSAITCGEFTLGLKNELIFLQPKQEIVIRFSVMFGVSNTSLEQAAEEATLGINQYVMVGSECLYEKKGTAGSDSVCFPGDARVGGKTMKQMSIGDEVVIDNAGTKEKVLGFSHKDMHLRTIFVSLHTDMGKLTATPGHYVHVIEDDTTTGTATMEKMDAVKEGWRLVHESGMYPVVTKKSYSIQSGVWNPHTKSGSIVVDGFVASCYTKTVEPVAAHALLTPLRAVVGGAMRDIWGLFNYACGVFQSW